MTVCLFGLNFLNVHNGWRIFCAITMSCRVEQGSVWAALFHSAFFFTSQRRKKTNIKWQRFWTNYFALHYVVIMILDFLLISFDLCSVTKLKIRGVDLLSQNQGCFLTPCHFINEQLDSCDDTLQPFLIHSKQERKHNRFCESF